MQYNSTTASIRRCSSDWLADGLGHASGLARSAQYLGSRPIQKSSFPTQLRCYPARAAFITQVVLCPPRIQTEERLGSLIAAAGAIWVAHEGTKGLASIWQFTLLPPGPLEVCAIGILVWLHAKWRRSTKVE